MHWNVGGLAAAVLLTGLCSNPVPLTADVSAVASTSVVAGATAQLVVKVTNTGPAIPQLGLVFRTTDRWYERHRMTSLGGCTVATDTSAFNCGDFGASETKTFSFYGVATAAGTFHYELALRELVQPFAYVNDHTDGPDVQTWDETVTLR
jgi:hypothetical protein